MDKMLADLLKTTTTQKADTSGSGKFMGVDLAEFGLAGATEERLQAVLTELRTKIANGESLTLEEAREAVAILRKNRIEAAEANAGKKKTLRKSVTKAEQQEKGTALLDMLTKKE